MVNFYISKFSDPSSYLLSCSLYLFLTPYTPLTAIYNSDLSLFFFVVSLKIPGVGLITGGWFASAVIGKVVDLGRSYIGDNYDLHTGTREMLENLESHLPRIQTVIEEAEKQLIISKGLATWLEQLKDAAYEAEDVLDDFEAQRIRESIKGKGKVTEIASSSVKMVKTLMFSDNDFKKLKYVVKKLDKLCMGDLLKALQLTQSDKRKEHLGKLGCETSSNLAPGVAIFGRDKEIGLILDMILNILYVEIYHQALDDLNLQQGEVDPNLQQREHDSNLQQGEVDPNLQQGELHQGKNEGSSSLWGLHAIPIAVKSLVGLSKHLISKFRKTVKKGGVPEGSEPDYDDFDDSPRGPQLLPLLPTSLEQSTTTDIITTIIEPHSISNWKLAVIPIVGVGRVGKTAVAKKVYNNERVKEHFSFKAWVYISENCDAKKIMQDILCSFRGRIIDPLMNLENVGNILKQTITNHRFLLILDDLRDKTELKWSVLRSVLCYGEAGSVVVVTTQSKSIANTIRTLPEVMLDVLQPESYWELFQYYAFGGFKLGDLNDQPPLLPSKQEELKKIGKEIAERLHGLPLAGEVIGILLNTRLEKEFWEDISRSDWWNIEGARENILPSIGVGYNYLDPELKQCFVFCSIFPKHYVFERKRLVQMWIAHGFIQPSKEETSRLDKGDIRLEDIGRKWFGKLVDRSFLQLTISDGKYIMHDLVRDLAIAISSNDFCFVKSHDKHLPFLARHLGIDCDSLEVELKWKNSTRVRTMLFFGNWANYNAKSISNIFGKNNGLRVLDLSYIVLLTNEPINVACQLSHLRFVDLSFTGIKSIPDEFCALCHLEVLDVRGCNFEKLPEGMNKLINLRHLYASSRTISLISNIGKLTKLQELEEFCIGESKGHRISELMEMNEISGHLLLSNVNNVSSKEAAAKAQLEKKKYLKSLKLIFVRFFDEPTNEVEMEVLNALKPACSLEILKVCGCRSFPAWVFSPHHGFNNLKVIHVSNFWSRSLPAFGELPSLELLSFDYLPLIEKVGCEFYGSSNEVFPSLKELTFSRMGKWRDWLDAEAGKKIFPHLKKLHLLDCNGLYKLPTDCFTSSVEALILSDCKNLRFVNIQTVMPSVAHLSITEILSPFSDCPLSIDCTPSNSLEVINLSLIREVRFVGGLKSLVNLRKLVIIGFHKILDSYELEQENEEQCLQFLSYLHLSYHGSSRSLSFPIRVLGRLSSLRTLLIENFIAKEYTSDEESWFNQLKSLEKLEFRFCWYLNCLPSQLHLLTSLKKLRIYCCHEILSLPENGLPQNLAELRIECCSNLIPRCQPNEGDDWHKISHIPFVHLEY